MGKLFLFGGVGVCFDVLEVEQWVSCFIFGVEGWYVLQCFGICVLREQEIPRT